MARVRACLYRPGRGVLSASQKKRRRRRGAADRSHHASPESPSSVGLLLIGSSVDLAKSSWPRREAQVFRTRLDAGCPGSVPPSSQGTGLSADAAQQPDGGDTSEGEISI